MLSKGNRAVTLETHAEEQDGVDEVTEESSNEALLETAPQ